MKDAKSIIDCTQFGGWIDTKHHYGWPRHHMIHGTAGRKFSSQYGLWVYLPSAIHDEVHNGKATFYDSVQGREVNRIDNFLERLAQKAFEKKFSHEKWMAEWGKNYLEDNDESNSTETWSTGRRV